MLFRSRLDVLESAGGDFIVGGRLLGLALKIGVRHRRFLSRSGKFDLSEKPETTTYTKPLILKVSTAGIFENRHNLFPEQALWLAFRSQQRNGIFLAIPANPLDDIWVMGASVTPSSLCRPTFRLTWSEVAGRLGVEVP